MKKNISLLIIIGLIVITGLSLSRFFYLQKENIELARVIKDNRAKIDDLAGQLLAQKDLNEILKKEKEELTAQLTSLSEEARKQQEELAQVNVKLSEIQTKVNLLKKENIYLAQLKATFDSKMAQLEKTNTDLTVKLSSIDELKKAIRDLKEKMRQDRIAARKGSKANQEIAGNRGYIIWKGQPTLKNKVRIEVIPAS